MAWPPKLPRKWNPVEHEDRLGRMNVELVEAALSAAGRRLVVRMTARSKTTWCATW